MKSFKRNVSLAVILTITTFTLHSQTEGVSISNSAVAPHPSAMLDVKSLNKGILVPRVTIQSLTSYAPVGTTPEDGLLVYNSPTVTGIQEGFYYWDNAQWNLLVTHGGKWFDDPLTTAGGNTGIYRDHIVSVGQGTDAAVHSTLMVNGPAWFFALPNRNSNLITIPSVPGSNWTTPGVGLHVGDPEGYQGVNGGHQNEINYYGDPLDLQWFTETDVRIGAYGGSNLLVHRGTDPNSGRGNIYADGDIKAIYGDVYAKGSKLISDSTMKKNMTEISSVINKVTNLGVFTYNFKTEADTDPKHIGVMAQQVETEFSELVTPTSTTYLDYSQGKNEIQQTQKTIKYVDYPALTAVLLKAIQEQQAIITDLQNRVELLEQQ